jgi:hypothetical protein
LKVTVQWLQPYPLPGYGLDPILEPLTYNRLTGKEERMINWAVRAQNLMRRMQRIRALNNLITDITEDPRIRDSTARFLIGAITKQVEREIKLEAIPDNWT